ncbi:hypothetical protein FRC09_005071 [Ceratobasidium sp. 395]|nr:hypothetical protein FRC09_005071 [Ceratobasidium sp. 395]
MRRCCFSPTGQSCPNFSSSASQGQQTLKKLAELACRYRQPKCSSEALGQQSQYMSTLHATLREIFVGYGELAVDTEVHVLQRDGELVTNTTVAPLSAIKATFAIWEEQFTSLRQLVGQFKAGPPPSHNSDRPWWPLGPLINIPLPRTRTGIRHVSAITNRLALGVQHVWQSHLLAACLAQGAVDAADSLASVEDG